MLAYVNKIIYYFMVNSLLILFIFKHLNVEILFKLCEEIMQSVMSNLYYYISLFNQIGGTLAKLSRN